MKLIKPIVLLLIAISFCPDICGFPCVKFSFSAQIELINVDGSHSKSKDIDRLLAVLKREGINTIGELSAAEYQEGLLQRKNIGMKSIVEVQKALELYGFRKYK